MDETPLRVRRMTTLSRHRRRASTSMSDTSPDSFQHRFHHHKKPHQVSRAQRMRPKPSPPVHGNPICIEPLMQGDCNSAHLRYYYDRDTDTCRLFYYTGCKGNNNNFGSLIDCQKLCVLGGQRPRPDHRSFISPSPILRGQCPNGDNPLGGLTPVLCGNSTDSIGCPVGYYCLAGPPDVCCPSGKDRKRRRKQICSICS
ncbi:NAD(P)H-quinone oxidoreductase subunit 5, chloroplastic [Parelaphostrongylus tenuis]|uniref:NAD(P)H-quinone oxidoreductase subunit 5, chloroplastic n=1 Tax=Parelaphostrongylus tenuis TaxID=148309 RepID=A0AAD5WEE2_PARTN|nr:NAD(P)H-quinone oxidoreductase subunit 5, chloroplastic [Parelaphostrongylus tenuis]